VAVAMFLPHGNIQGNPSFYYLLLRGFQIPPFFSRGSCGMALDAHASPSSPKRSI
jgi:hypothetical protein